MSIERPTAASIARVPIIGFESAAVRARNDSVAVEEPLEIRLGFDAAVADVPVGGRAQRSVSVTMRTPGHDDDLAAGFLFTEGIIDSREQITGIRYCHRQGERIDGNDAPVPSNVIRVELAAGVAVDLERLERHFYTTSSCGVCGKTSIEAVRASCKRTLADGPLIDAAIIHSLPARLRDAQAVFEQTGGLHAAALFDANGTLLDLREDVGRHNAVDKLIGSRFLSGRLPLSNSIVLLSGRASFELVQKAMMAALPILASVGAPSSLAIELAASCGMTLLGFVRNERFNIYSGGDRISR